jgi:hypothetical protein
MIRIAGCLFVLGIVLSGCAMGKPVPDGYAGPTARINDTSHPRSSTSVDFFYVSEVNGREIPNSVTETRSANYGRGFNMTPQVTSRLVPAEPSTFKIYGRTEHAAPILALVNKVYEVSGTSTFTPLPDHLYRVVGELQPDHSAVWIEDVDTQQMVGQKIEISGAATLNFFEK